MGQPPVLSLIFPELTEIPGGAILAKLLSPQRRP